MELEEFRIDLLERAGLNAAAETGFDRTGYLECVIHDLIESDECSDFTPCYYEGTGSKGRKIEIDGYDFDESDSTFSIFICAFSGDKHLSSITKTDVEKLATRAAAFITESYAGVVQQNADESSQGYGLALELYSLRDSIQRYRVFVITDGIKSDRIKTIDLDEIDGKPTALSLWDISNFYDLMISKSGYEDLEIDLSEFGYPGIPCLKAYSDTAQYDSYLCIMPGPLLVKLFDKYGSRLLQANVRSFLRFNNKTNKGIRATLLKEPDMFFAYNNGISTTATDIVTNRTSEGLMITGFTSLQIVNGGQTTASLHALSRFRDNPDLDRVFVPMKISVIPPKESEDIVPKISKSANTQSKVSDSDFFSNHKFHMEMEKLSRKTRVPAPAGATYSTRWYYERTRGQYNQDRATLSKAELKKFDLENPKSQYFTKTDLAKYWNSYERLPHIVSKGAQDSFKRFADRISEEWKKSPAKFNETYFKESVALAILFRKTESIVSDQPWYSGGYRANIVTYTIAKLSDLLENKEAALDLKKIWDTQSISEPLQNQIVVISARVYESIVNDGTEDNVTQWCKKADCWKRIQSLNIDLLPEMRECIVSKKSSNWERKTATRKQTETNQIQALIEVVNQGEDYWRGAYEWGVEHGLLNGFDKELLRTAMNLQRKRPSEKQAVNILKIRDRLREDGYSR